MMRRPEEMGALVSTNDEGNIWLDDAFYELHRVKQVELLSHWLGEITELHDAILEYRIGQLPSSIRPVSRQNRPEISDSPTGRTTTQPPIRVL